MNPYFKVLRQDLAKVGKGIKWMFVLFLTIINGFAMVGALPLFMGNTAYWHTSPTELKWFIGWGVLCWAVVGTASLFFWVVGVVDRAKKEQDNELSLFEKELTKRI